MAVAPQDMQDPEDRFPVDRARTRHRRRRMGSLRDSRSTREASRRSCHRETGAIAVEEVFLTS